MTTEKEMLLVGSKTKEAIKGEGLNMASDALEKLNERVHLMVKDAQERAVANGRKTVRAGDF
jgi:hypothetical protein